MAVLSYWGELLNDKKDRHKPIVQLKLARMMQDYEFNYSTSTSSGNVGTPVQPSPEVVQNILQYARCFQNIRMGDVKIKVYLN